GPTARIDNRLPSLERVEKDVNLCHVFALVSVKGVGNKVLEVVFRPIPGECSRLAPLGQRNLLDQAHRLRLPALIFIPNALSCPVLASADLDLVEALASNLKILVEAERRTVIDEGVQNVDQHLLK